MNSSPIKFHSDLAGARGSRTLVRLRRSVEPGWANGYVVDISADLVVLSLVSDLIIFNGFQVFRIGDLSSVEVPAPHASFVERVLRLRDEPWPQAPRLDLGDLPSLLRSASAAFPLIAVHREVEDPDICHIGVVEDIVADTLVLKTIGPDAKWDEERETLVLSDVTRIDFGGRYEAALNLVAEAG